MKSKSLSLLAVVVCLSGCAFSAVKRPNVGQYLGQFPQSESFPFTVEEGLAASKSSIEAMGWETLAVNLAIGLVRSKPRPVTTPNICDCGTWNGATISGTADATLVVNLEPGGPGRTAVRVSVECVTNFAGQNLYGATTRRETYACASRGAVENEFWATLKRVLAATSGKR